MTAEFRLYLFAPDDPLIMSVKGLDAYAYREAGAHGDQPRRGAGSSRPGGAGCDSQSRVGA
jgi:hypothetical protein